MVGRAPLKSQMAIGKQQKSSTQTRWRTVKDSRSILPIHQGISNVECLKNRRPQNRGSALPTEKFQMSKCLKNRRPKTGGLSYGMGPPLELSIEDNWQLLRLGF